MLFAGLFAVLLSANEMMIPEGTILPVVLNETLNTAKIQENDPILLFLADDIRAAGRRGVVVIPRGSSVVGRIVTSQRAGHFFGRSAMDIRVQEIITPTGEAYGDLSAKVVDIAKRKGEKGEVKADGGIRGPVHRGRDTFFLLFPPTTIFQLMATPKRGPDVVLPVETRLYVKLMTPIYVDMTPRILTPLSQPAPVPVPVPSTSVPYPRVAPQTLLPISANGMEILVAPVALYPDVILRDLFRASTHPFEIVQANQWVHQVRDAWGSLPSAGFNDSWDASVKALTAYPDLLQRLTADVDWMTKLGTTYMVQPLDVMSAVQRLRMQSTSLRSPSSFSVSASGR